MKTYAVGAVASELVAVGDGHSHEGEEDGDLKGNRTALKLRHSHLGVHVVLWSRYEADCASGLLVHQYIGAGLLLHAHFLRGGTRPAALPVKAAQNSKLTR
ncbi:hypothetical protein E2C01_060640 [Portunus trituberculatus]|uniref:Uncharacterized protein n=1 Tax=Portunus trituberculatus TaxID=210409 RepID=A0A5B7H619_PORTR|nr:hypothetical protein [Portunus trituberculatus]